jgi:hypothetical protein
MTLAAQRLLSGTHNLNHACMLTLSHSTKPQGASWLSHRSDMSARPVASCAASMECPWSWQWIRLEHGPELHTA